MTIRHVHVPAKRTPAEAAQLRADRERYQRDLPTPEQLLAEGGHENFVTLGELLQLHEIITRLKQERARQGMTLARLAEQTGMDQAALSRLENGRNANPTLDTLHRVAAALGKAIYCTIGDAVPPEEKGGTASKLSPRRKAARTPARGVGARPAPSRLRRRTAEAAQREN